MGRQLRPSLPGCVFHLSARMLPGLFLFTDPLRTAALAAIAERAPPARVRVLAVAIMTNHLHIVVQQGDRPLEELMQPLLRRLALLVQRAHGREGPVFWRPYDAQACLDPEYARNAVVYTNLNPVRAGLCDDAGLYPWASHAVYAGLPDRDAAPGADRCAALFRRLIDPVHALPLFATAPERRFSQLREDYRGFIAWRLAADRAEAEERAPPPPPAAPSWAGEYGPLFRAPARGADASVTAALRPPAPDLSDIARGVLIRFAPDVRLEQVRGRGGGRRCSQLRHRMIRDMAAAGYRNRQIARFLGLSDSAVSKVLRSPRRPE